MDRKTTTGKVEAFRAGVQRYWQESGRKDLPWRGTNDPWKVLIAEVVLRKTTAHQAVPAYRQLMHLPPDVLAAMSAEELEAILRPLGLYRVRARQLIEISATVAEAPPEALQSESFLISLPGVGKYIANSVLCFAFGAPKPALDTNMIRVLQRVFSWQSNRRRLREDRDLWEFAERLVSTENCREFNWGVLDLGNAICTPQEPKCPDCPLNSICDYYRRTHQSHAEQDERSS